MSLPKGKVLKYKLDGIGKATVLKLPKNSIVTHVGYQPHAFFIWALVNSKETKLEARIFLLVPTNVEVRGQVECVVGSIELPQAQEVYHVLEMEIREPKKK